MTGFGRTIGSTISAGAAALLLVAAPGATMAQEAQADADGWSFEAAMYAFVPEIRGNVTVNGRTASARMNIDDLLQSIELGAMGHFEARYEKLALFLDGSYGKFSQETEGSPVDLEVELEQVTVEAGAAYQIASIPLCKGRRMTVEPLTGLRYWYFDTDYHFDRLPDSGDDADWVDWFAGARTTIELADRLAFRFRADTGGFGIGSSADESWTLTALLSYRVMERMSLMGGYRMIDVERKSGDNGLDLQFRGPGIAATLHF